MLVSYAEALEILKDVGVEFSAIYNQATELVAIQHAVKRINKTETRIQKATPPFDTSAMDGYAVYSEYTKHASPSNPVLFCVKGVMAAGDAPLTVHMLPKDTVPPCVEIATGAQFPANAPPYLFDACVRLEDVMDAVGPSEGVRYVQIVTPVKKNQNRRLQGNDFQKTDIVVPAMMPIRPQHVMALASSGIASIEVLKKPRIALWSTGSELLRYDSTDADNNRIRDSNGPFLLSALQELVADVEYFGIIQDDPRIFENTIKTQIRLNAYDLIITTGAVSKGRFDYVREGIERLGADIKFHNVAVRPGHPILFATLLDDTIAIKGRENHLLNQAGRAGDLGKRTAFFGLPGNPIASAVGLRFFVMPYLRHLTAQPPEKAISARIRVSDISQLNIHNPIRNPSHLDSLRHGFMWQDEGVIKAEMSLDQGPSKIKPWLEANCWIMIPSGHGILNDGDILSCFPMLADLIL